MQVLRGLTYLKIKLTLIYRMFLSLPATIFFNLTVHLFLSFVSKKFFVVFKKARYISGNFNLKFTNCVGFMAPAKP